MGRSVYSFVAISSIWYVISSFWIAIALCCFHTPYLPGDKEAHEGGGGEAVVDVEELDGLVGRAGERVLVVGQRHEGLHVSVCSWKVFSRVPSRSHTRTVLSVEPLRMRWPSGIAATA